MKRICTLLLCLALAATLAAQQRQPTWRSRQQFSPEQFRRDLETFVTREASLTPIEAHQFFPMLHEMLEKQRKNKDEAREIMRKCDENTSEREYEQILTKALRLDVRNAEIEQAYCKKFHSVLSWKKIHKVRIALFRFNMQALRNFAPPQPARNPQRTGAQRR